eukprot:scaffold116599_cov64-Phaeocystis_antarctica.AAC.4
MRLTVQRGQILNRTARRVASRATHEAPEAQPAVFVESRPLVVGVVPFDCPFSLRPEGSKGGWGGCAVHPDANTHGGWGRWAGQERAVTEKPVELAMLQLEARQLDFHEVPSVLGSQRRASEQMRDRRPVGHSARRGTTLCTWRASQASARSRRTRLESLNRGRSSRCA